MSVYYYGVANMSLQNHWLKTALKWFMIKACGRLAVDSAMVLATRPASLAVATVGPPTDMPWAECKSGLGTLISTCITGSGGSGARCCMDRPWVWGCDLAEKIWQLQLTYRKA